VPDRDRQRIHTGRVGTVPDPVDVVSQRRRRVDIGADVAQQAVDQGRALPDAGPRQAASYDREGDPDAG